MTDWLDKFTPLPAPPGNQFLGAGSYKFDPHATAPVAPQTGVKIVLPPARTGPPLQVRDVILKWNNQMGAFAHGATVLSLPAEGITIPKSTQADADRLSTRIKPSAAAYQIPLTLAIAEMLVEGAGAIPVINKNIGDIPGTTTPRSNPTGDEGGFDVGPVQLKLKFLVSIAPGVKTLDDAMAFALDPDKAIPYFCSLMAVKYTWAINVIAANTSSAPDPRLSDAYILATDAYNYGCTGVMVYYESGQFPMHGAHVLTMEDWVANELGVTSLFAALS